MKKLAELLVCFLHPVAVVLVWLNVLVRPDLCRNAKIAWAVLPPGADRAVGVRTRRRRAVGAFGARPLR